MNKKVLIDKQALIDELMKIPGVGSNSDALETIKRFPSYEPQKPVVLQFVADWFEENKCDLENNIFYECVRAMEICRGERTEFQDWFSGSKNRPIEILIRMKDGYEVEKKPLYRVKIGEGYFVEYQGRGALIMSDCNKEIKIFDSKSDAERTAQTIGGTVEEVEEG